MKLNGIQRRPIIKAREKLSVARVDRKIPRRRRENDLMSRYCCGVGEWTRPCVNTAARRRGRKKSTTVKV